MFLHRSQMLGMGEVYFKSFSLVLPCYRNFCSTLFLLVPPPPASLDQSLLCSKSLSISWTRFSICSTSMCAYVCVCCMRVSYAQDSIKALRACLSLSLSLSEDFFFKKKSCMCVLCVCVCVSLRLSIYISLLLSRRQIVALATHVSS